MAKKTTGSKRGRPAAKPKALEVVDNTEKTEEKMTEETIEVKDEEIFAKETEWKEEVPKGFKFPNKKVVVRPIFRNGFTPIGHEANFLFKDAPNRFDLPRLLTTGSYKDPFKSDEEREALERALRINLNPYDEKESYFLKYTVRLGKRDFIMDLSDPQQYLQYIILRANSERIASNWADRNRKKSYLYAFVDMEAVEREELGREEVAAAAAERYLDLKKSPDDMRAVLVANGKSIAKHTKTNFILKEFYNFYEKTPHRAFVENTNDMETIRLKALMYDALKSKAIVVNHHGAYILPDTPGSIATSDGELLTWLKDPVNSQEVAKIRFRSGYNNR